MHLSDITTPRLRLVTITHEFMNLESSGQQEALGRMVGAAVPAAWPPQDWEPHVFEFLRKQYSDSPHTLGWARYVVTLESPTFIGTVGAFPHTAQLVEVGYGILPAWQKQGLATEATLALLAKLFREPGVTSAIAHTFPTLPASIRVLEKCGFHPAGPGEEPGTLRFEWRPGA